MKNKFSGFTENSVFFISPDFKRALGPELFLPNYHIVCANWDPLIITMRSYGIKIFCLKEKTEEVLLYQNSAKLFSNQRVQEYIKSNISGTPFIMYFKPSLKLDQLIEESGYKAIGNISALNEIFENKIICGQLLQKNFPANSPLSYFGILGSMKFNLLSKSLGLPYVVQFGHGWAGKTTFFIKDENEFMTLSLKFPYTKVKVSKYVDGLTVLNNCCIYNDEIFISSSAIQLCNIPKLYSVPSVTCGRQWPNKFLSLMQSKEITALSEKIGRIMLKRGYKGFFGIDFLIDKKNGGVFISEVNARLTASSSFYTYMEQDVVSIPLLAYHLAAFLGTKLGSDYSKRCIKGAQIILRKDIQIQFDFPIKEDMGVYKLENDKSVLLRREYKPNYLSGGEYIILRNKEINIKESDELARIETKEDVLDSEEMLNGWMEKILF